MLPRHSRAVLVLDIGKNVPNVERQRCGGHMIDKLLRDLEEVDELAGNGSSDVERFLTLAFLSYLG